MDLIRLDRDAFLPDMIIEEYTSLIWTERYETNGEFELKTGNILETLDLLPEMALVSHRETDEVMYVETHTLTLSETGQWELTVKGRSLETFGEQRVIEGPYPKKKYKMARTYTAAEAASVIYWNAFVNPSENDVTRIGDGTRDLLDNIPNVVVTDNTTIAGKSKRRWLTGGQVYSQVLDLLQQNHLGLRAVRPSSKPGKIVTVTTNDKGIISYDKPDKTSSLRFDIYNGVDRRRQQTDVDPVIFDYGGRYLSDKTYLFSVAAYSTMAMVVSDVGTKKYYRDKRNDKDLAGFDRRVLWIDGGEPGDPDFPKNATDAEKDQARAENKAEFLEDLEDKASTELEKNDRIKLFDSKIAENAPYKYGRDYGLGDKVTLVGEFGIEQSMRVVEYIRTEDSSGDSGYPTLSVMNDED